MSDSRHIVCHRPQPPQVLKALFLNNLRHIEQYSDEITNVAMLLTCGRYWSVPLFLGLVVLMVYAIGGVSVSRHGNSGGD